MGVKRLWVKISEVGPLDSGENARPSAVWVKHNRHEILIKFLFVFNN